MLRFVQVLVAILVVTNLGPCNCQEECLPTQGDAMVYESASLSLEMDDEDEASYNKLPEKLEKGQENAIKTILDQVRDAQETTPQRPAEQHDKLSPEHHKAMESGSVGIGNKLHERANHVPLELAMVQADGTIARLIRNKRADPAAIASMLTVALNAALKAIMAFTAEPPQIHDGIKNLGKDLLTAFDPLLQESNLDQKGYEEFKVKWNNHFDNLPDALAEIEDKIRLFTNEGDAVALIEGIEEIMETANDAVLMFLPKQTSEEVDKFMTAATGVVDAIGNAWKDFQDKRMAEGTEQLYFSLRKVIDELIPAEVRNGTGAYSIVTGSIDAVMGQITKTTYAYRNRLLSSAICYRSNRPRDSIPAAVCGSDQQVIQRGHKRGCDKKAGLLQSNETLNVDQDMVDRVATGKGEETVDTSTAKKDFNSDTATFAKCDENSDYWEYHSHKCFGKCPKGWHPDRKTCRISCGGDFGAESLLVCGKSAAQVTQWIIQLAMQVAMAIVQLVGHIVNIEKQGFKKETVEQMVSALTSLGEPFVNPMCVDVMTS